MMWC